MKIDKYGWQFNVDIQKTQLMYSDRLKSIIDKIKIQINDLLKKEVK